MTAQLRSFTEREAISRDRGHFRATLQGVVHGYYSPPPPLTPESPVTSTHIATNARSRLGILSESLFSDTFCV